MWLVNRIMRQQPNTHPEQWATDGANEPRRARTRGQNV
jgi:hypothetical protein